jgi:hypothetical protein
MGVFIYKTLYLFYGSLLLMIKGENFMAVAFIYNTTGIAAENFKLD